MTQTELDNIVISMAGWETDMAYKAALLRKQNDPDCNVQEEALMFLQNVMNSLRNYDVTEDILTDAEINYLFELATLAIQTCPM